MGEIVVTTRIRAAAAICFDAALDVSAHVESAKFSHERLVAPGRLEGLLQLNDLVCFEGRHFGIKQTFCARITELDRPRRFVDEMVRGAFRWLRHVHEFEETNGVTTMIDRLDWRAPVGAIADLFLVPHMRNFVTKKQNALKTLVETGPLRM